MKSSVLLLAVLLRALHRLPGDVLARQRDVRARRPAHVQEGLRGAGPGARAPRQHPRRGDSRHQRRLKPTELDVLCLLVYVPGV